MLEPDRLIDRRRLKRRLNVWRVVAVLAVVVALVAVARPGGRGIATSHVARVNITGVITDGRKLTEAILALRDDRSVPAVIVSVDSPGGSVAGGESLHDAIEKVAAAKPVVAVMRGTAASAGYMVSVPAERIFARASTLTGSIGVILETVEISGLLTTLGIDPTAITSGPLKDQPSLTRPLTSAGRAYLDGLVQDMFDQFVTIVAEGRHMAPDAVRKLADGRAYTGSQAKALGLVDEIGGEADAREWLAKQHGVATSVPARDVEIGSLYERTFGATLGSLADGTRAAVQRMVSPTALAIWPVH